MDHQSDIDRLKRSADQGAERFGRHGHLDMRYVRYGVVPLLQEIVNDAAEEIRKSHRMKASGDVQVTHYTSVRVIVSMLQALECGESACLRLYDSLHQNDPGEGKHLASILAYNPKYKWLTRVGSVESGHAYLASFVKSQDGQDAADDLLLWRTYGDNGRGCSLTFEVPRSILLKVGYGEQGVSCAKKALTPVLDAVTPLAQCHDDHAEEISRAIWECLSDVRYLYKDKAYDFEKEFRVLRDDTDTGPTRYVYNQSMDPSSDVRHYREVKELRLLQLLEKSGSKIVIGPTARDRRSVCLYLEDLREKIKRRYRELDFDRKFEILESQILYRS